MILKNKDNYMQYGLNFNGYPHTCIYMHTLHHIVYNW